MATTSASLPFSKLNPVISLYTPALPLSALDHGLDPTTIVILQWMGASARSRSLISIYEKYHLLFPHARIISVRSLPEWFMSTSNSTRLSLIKPMISSVQSDPAPTPKVLVHLFSNGGSLAYADICTVFKAQKLRFVAKGIVLDSAPGQPDITEAWAAMSVSLPKGIFWYPTAAVTALLLGAVGVSKWIFGATSIVDNVYVALNDFDLTDRTAGRLYIYSEADKLVNSKDVERHMKGAQDCGVLVTSLKEVDTPHVQHVILDRQRYWAKIEEFWNIVKHN